MYATPCINNQEVFMHNGSGSNTNDHVRIAVDAQDPVQYCTAHPLQNNDTVNHPKHYTAHPSGIECIDVTRHFNFCLGNAIKYIWRADHKGNDIEDLRKAIRYLEYEIERRQCGAKRL